MCRGSGLAATVRLADVPLLPRALALAGQGFVTGASGRNWAGYGEEISLHDVSAAQRALLTDPQTSGGLLVACAPDSVAAVLETFRSEGFAHAAVIGELSSDLPAGVPHVTVRGTVRG